MDNLPKRSRQNRTITVDFNNEQTYHRLCHDGPRFIDKVVAFILSIGFQLKHKCDCSGGKLTRHSHYARLRLNGLTIWRIQCTGCRTVFTVLPHFVLRYRKMKASIAKKMLLATHGGLSLEICAVIENVCPMAIYRLVCCIGRTCLVKLLTRCHLPLPEYFIADEKHSHCLAKRVYLPTIGCGRVIWHLGYTTAKSVSAFTTDYGEFKRAAKAIDTSYQVKGILTDGFNSTKKSLGQLFPLAKLAFCMLHATFKLPAQIKGVTKAVRQTLCGQFRQIFFVNKTRKTPNSRSLGQRLRRFAEQVTHLGGGENGMRVRKWIQRKKPGWHVLFADANIPRTTTLVDQFHNAIDRKLFMMKGLHHANGSQRVYLNGFAILANLIPYQRRAINGGKCAIEVEGGKVPTTDWFLNLQILTSGGFQ